MTAVHDPPAAPSVSLESTNHGDRIFRLVLTLAAAAIPVLLALLVYELWSGARLAIGRFGFDFVTSSTWDPVAEEFGAFPLIFGTLVSSLIALLIAVPLSLGVAIYLTEFAPKAVRQPVAFLISLLAAIPSVVYGLWGIFVLIPLLRKSVFPLLRDVFGFLPLFQGAIYGPSMLAAGIILSIMVMPYVMSVSREVLMAVTMLIGNRHEVTASLFAPGYTMAAAIANEFSEAVGDMHLSALAYVAFLLFVVTVLVNAGARLLIWRVARGSGAGSKAL